MIVQMQCSLLDASDETLDEIAGCLNDHLESFVVSRMGKVLELRTDVQSEADVDEVMRKVEIAASETIMQLQLKHCLAFQVLPVIRPSPA